MFYLAVTNVWGGESHEMKGTEREECCIHKKEGDKSCIHMSKDFLNLPRRKGPRVFPFHASETWGTLSDICSC